MQLKLSLFLLAAVGHAAKVRTKTVTTTSRGATTTAMQSPKPTEITTTYFNRLGYAGTPEASVIGVNATSTNIITYLIKCPASANTTSTTSTSTSASAATASTAPPTSSSSEACPIPAEGITLVAGPSTMSYAYSDSSTHVTDYCTLMDGPTLSAGPSAQCTHNAMGKDQIQSQDAIAPTDVSTMFGKLHVTAGVQKLADATKTRAVPSSTSSAGAAAATGGRYHLLPAIGVAGAAGVFAAAVGL